MNAYLKTTRVLWEILVLTLALVAQTQAQSSFTDGLVAYYPFIGNANDASGNGFNLTNYGAVPCPDRFGTSNRAYYFNGGSYLGCSTPPLTQADNWTLTAWLQPASLSQNDAFVVCMGENAQLNNGFGFGLSGGNQLYAFYPGLTFASDNYVFLSTNQWYQVALVSDSGVATLLCEWSFEYDELSKSADCAAIRV
jgi:hypothetical protein